MARRSTSRYAILGLLSWGPATGYEIKKLVEDGIEHFWSESYGQIYPTLRSLADDGFAVCSLEPQQGRPDRKRYTITEKGRRELDAWLDQPSAIPRVRNEPLLKLFLSRGRPPARIAETLLPFVHAQEKILLDYRASETVLAARRDESLGDLLNYLSLRQGVLVAEARLCWAREAIASLDVPASLSSPGSDERGES